MRIEKSWFYGGIGVEIKLRRVAEGMESEYLIVINIDWILKKSGFESREIIVSDAILHRKKNATLRSAYSTYLVHNEMLKAQI